MSANENLLYDKTAAKWRGMTDTDLGNANGVTVTTNTTAVTGGNFRAITMLADTVFSVLTETGVTGQSMTSITLPAGLTIFGNFTAYTLASGAVRAYNA